MSKKILFLSKDNLTSNPRLQKELKLTVEAGFEVDFIGFYSGNWSDKIDEEIIKQINANFHYISANRNSFFKWFLSSLIEKISQKIVFLFKNNFKINAFASSKRSFLLDNYLKSNNRKYDLIIAHTLSTLYPAYKFSKKTKTPFIFDIEDYHPGEIISANVNEETKRRIFLMKNILPKASYLTYASPLIGEHSIDLLNGSNIPKHSLINNCFSQKEFVFVQNNSEKIKFVWFSQNIAKGRGLEMILPALAKYKDKVELTLIGNLYQDFYNDFLFQFSDFTIILPPLPQKELNLSLSKYDIGLAIELTSADFNRNICLTNKIFSYAQSGLFIFATDTSAQKLFMEENPEFGSICEQSIQSFEILIADILNKKEEIRSEKQNRFECAKKLAFENEGLNLLKIWEDILNS